MRAGYRSTAVKLTVVLLATSAAFGQRFIKPSTSPKANKSAKSTPRGTPVRKVAARTPDTDATTPAATTTTDGLAWQTALDRAGFSPGVIDGYVGRKAATAIRAFQQHAGLPITGQADDATASALGISREPKTRTYTVTADDLALIKPAPRGWIEKSKATLLGYESAAAMLAERGHCTKRFVAALNPRTSLSKIKVGDAVTLPNVGIDMGAPRAAALEIDLENKLIKAVDASGKAVGLFHCSIAANKMKRPSGTSKIERVAENPTYLFDPDVWPEVKGVKDKLVIPAGPRSPVGLCWIGLSLPGYGIHGTPEPELIGKTGSHGCFRLTNWDALRLAKMVQVGTEVRFSGQTTATTAEPPIIIRSAGMVEEVP